MIPYSQYLNKNKTSNRQIVLHTKAPGGQDDIGYNGWIRGSREIPFCEYFIIDDRSILNAIDAHAFNSHSIEMGSTPTWFRLCLSSLFPILSQEN
ncbi:MAG: hypothetical protein IPJ71_17965 [Bdellovibrionales bacterium]|nr:hypothetical protein [Bdellovibrionales bacterium]